MRDVYFLLSAYEPIEEFYDIANRTNWEICAYKLLVQHKEIVGCDEVTPMNFVTQVAVYSKTWQNADVKVTIAGTGKIALTSQLTYSIN